MNLAAINLNLLTALDALLDEASVGRAARRIGLSQPAMSHALRRLRDLIGDPLLVRVRGRMELTARAERLRAPLREALDRVGALFEPDGFDPATSTRRFTTMMPDLVVDLLMPALVERIGASAPQVRLDVIPWRGAVTADVARSIDLAIHFIPDAFPGLHRQRLYGDRDALAVRRRHPAAARLRRLDAFLAARHVAVVGAGEREDFIDGFLRGQGIERRIALTVPSYLQALRMAARTDLVAFVPSRLIAALGRPLGLVAVRPPVDPGMDDQFLFYPTRAQEDPGSIWLRGLVAEVARSLEGRPG
ncbi:MAG TPA: LysR family transcriptional regulator [Kofleriaceae bacterium]|nr:LysR family transcriptional regulator [Kofleriaceae bacterium]